jgi:hypothetical protein
MTHKDELLDYGSEERITPIRSPPGIKLFRRSQLVEPEGCEWVV